MERIDADFEPENPCYICGDADDHDGVPHSVATQDGRSRADRDREVEHAGDEFLEEQEQDPRCVCDVLAHHWNDPDGRCTGSSGYGGSDYCTACTFGCFS